MYKDIEKLNEAVALIKKDCKKYLEVTKDLPGLFYRGTGSGGQIIIPDMLFKWTVRKDRKPVGMKQKAADALNKYLVKHGHCSRAKSVMANSERDYTTVHGPAYYFFPIGDFNYTFARANDMNWDWTYDRVGKYDKYFLYQAIALGNYKEFPDKFFTTNENIHQAQDAGYEIWFDCDHYYTLIIVPIPSTDLLEMLRE